MRKGLYEESDMQGVHCIWWDYIRRTVAEVRKWNCLSISFKRKDPRIEILPFIGCWKSDVDINVWVGWLSFFWQFSWLRVPPEEL